jgi:hypothetical protein
MLRAGPTRERRAASRTMLGASRPLQVGSAVEEMLEMGRDAYLLMSRKVFKALLEKWDEEAANKNAHEDWEADTARGGLHRKGSSGRASRRTLDKEHSRAWHKGGSLDSHMLCYAMPCHATLCYAMLCHAMPCYAMLCYAMLCYAGQGALLRRALRARRPALTPRLEPWQA